MNSPPERFTPSRRRDLPAASTSLVPDQEPRNPALTLAPEPREPFQLSLAAVTVVPDWDHLAFQPWVTFWPPAKSKVSCQLLSADRLLVIFTEPWKPLSHWLVTA